MVHRSSTTWTCTGSWRSAADPRHAGRPPLDKIGNLEKVTGTQRRVPQAIADLEHAAEFFKDRAKKAHELAKIPPPGLDGVSVNAVIQIGKWASDAGTNNLEATLVAGAKQLEDLARKFREDLQTYLQVEELNIPHPTPGLPL